jgi:hypothetical protein
LILRNGSDLIFKKVDRIYRIIRIFLFPVSGRNREYANRFAELAFSLWHSCSNSILAIDEHYFTWDVW